MLLARRGLSQGGYLTDPPSCLTYSFVVSRENVRIAFIIADVNGYEIIATDVPLQVMSLVMTKGKRHCLCAPYMV
jgi:hypothetical protein